MVYVIHMFLQTVWINTVFTNLALSYHLYYFLGSQRLVHKHWKTDKTLAKLLNKSNDSTHYRNKTFVNNIE